MGKKNIRVYKHLIEMLIEMMLEMFPSVPIFCVD